MRYRRDVSVLSNFRSKANPGLFWSKQDSEGGKAVSLLLNITLEVGVSCPAAGRWAAGPDDGQRRRIG